MPLQENTEKNILHFLDIAFGNGRANKWGLLFLKYQNFIFYLIKTWKKCYIYEKNMQKRKNVSALKTKYFKFLWWSRPSLKPVSVNLERYVLPVV